MKHKIYKRKSDNKFFRPCFPTDMESYPATIALFGASLRFYFREVEWVRTTGFKRLWQKGYWIDKKPVVEHLFIPENSPDCYFLLEEV